MIAATSAPFEIHTALVPRHITAGSVLALLEAIDRSPPEGVVGCLAARRPWQPLRRRWPQA